MIDLHSHILPGLDDGARDLDESLAMAAVAIDEGIQTIAATPHVSHEYPLEARAIANAAGTLNVALARNELPLAVLPGAELAIAKAADMKDDELRSLSLGASRCLLLESPYAGGIDTLSELVFALQVRGFRPLLAHPERSRAIQQHPEELAELVRRGALTCVNAASLGGAFGSRSQRCALDLLDRDLVHAIASDAHDADARAPTLRPGIDAVCERRPQLLADYYTRLAPAAILGGRPLPPRPRSAPASRRSPLRRIFSG